MNKTATEDGKEDGYSTHTTGVTYPKGRFLNSSLEVTIKKTFSQLQLFITHNKLVLYWRVTLISIFNQLKIIYVVNHFY